MKSNKEYGKCGICGKIVIRTEVNGLWSDWKQIEKDDILHWLVKEPAGYICKNHDAIVNGFNGRREICKLADGRYEVATENGKLIVPYNEISDICEK